MQPGAISDHSAHLKDFYETHPTAGRSGGNPGPRRLRPHRGHTRPCRPYWRHWFFRLHWIHWLYRFHRLHRLYRRNWFDRLHRRNWFHRRDRPKRRRNWRYRCHRCHWLNRRHWFDRLDGLYRRHGCQRHDRRHSHRRSAEVSHSGSCLRCESALADCGKKAPVTSVTGAFLRLCPVFPGS